MKWKSIVLGLLICLTATAQANEDRGFFEKKSGISLDMQDEMKLVLYMQEEDLNLDAWVFIERKGISNSYCIIVKQAGGDEVFNDMCEDVRNAFEPVLYDLEDILDVFDLEEDVGFDLQIDTIKQEEKRAQYHFDVFVEKTGDKISGEVLIFSVGDHAYSVSACTLNAKTDQHHTYPQKILDSLSIDCHR